MSNIILCTFYPGYRMNLSPSDHSHLVVLHVDSLNTTKCSVTRSGQLVTFNVHQSTRAELRDSLMYHCHTVSGRTVQEGTGDANTSGGGLEGVLNGGLIYITTCMHIKPTQSKSCCVCSNDSNAYCFQQTQLSVLTLSY